MKTLGLLRIRLWNDDKAIRDSMYIGKEIPARKMQDTREGKWAPSGRRYLPYLPQATSLQPTRKMLFALLEFF